MDCLSLLENSSGNKSLHFANATQFFTFSQIYGLAFWSQLSVLLASINKREYQDATYMLTSYHHSGNNLRRLFANKEDLHLCQSAAEWLLEPWLVMQLPWHPAVYYQWLIAALAEVLKAKLQLVEFYSWPVPNELIPVLVRLLSPIETLHYRIISGFRLINWLSSSKKESKSITEINCQTVQCILNLIILPSLPIIKFLLGDQFNTVVRSLKRMIWPCEGVPTATAKEEYAAVCFSTARIDKYQLPVFYLSIDESGIATRMFGTIDSLQVIKDELAQMPCKVFFVPIEAHLNEIVII
jgi:hypothetical protein